jgi:AGCS family alanine or glycine:cation symporter
MCLAYMLCGLLILLWHADAVPGAYATIVRGAFSFEAGLGGFVGVLIQGFRRACFSNEAGAGSAAIAHSAARTDQPLREGMVALLEPFVDTLIVCNVTGLVIVVTGAYANPAAGSGIAMTSWAFATVFPWFPVLLSLIAFLFAYSTMISWSYYGEQCWAHLFGVRSILLYKTIFLIFTCLGARFEAKAVTDFGDMMILGMAFPNLIGVFLLSGQIKADLDVYWRKLQAGEFKRYF